MIKEIDSISDIEDIEYSIAQHDLLKKDFAISALTAIGLVFYVTLIG